MKTIRHIGRFLVVALWEPLVLPLLMIITCPIWLLLLAVGLTLTEALELWRKTKEPE